MTQLKIGRLFMVFTFSRCTGTLRRFKNFHESIGVDGSPMTSLHLFERESIDRQDVPIGKGVLAGALKSQLKSRILAVQP
jgi:hypothetical protein